MNQQEFSQLCRDTCIALRVSDKDLLATEGNLYVDGINIQLVFDEIFSNDRIVCICEIGKIQNELKEKIFESLLMLNFLTGGKTTGTFAIDPLRQCASFVVTLTEPDNLSADQLAELLQCYARRNSYLQKTLFRDGELDFSADLDVEAIDSFSNTMQFA